MARQLNSFDGVLRRAVSPVWLAIGVSLSALMGGAMAAQPGHGRVNSAPGAPLEVSIPLRGLTADDVKVLSASVADAAAWAQAGLTLPAAMESLAVTVEPGLESTSRTVVLKSTQAVNRPVIDVLIRLSTASGSRTIHSSSLVLPKDTSAGSASSVRVVRGDTLYAIALTKAVANADIYQVMWAIYEANPQAFMNDNMNLLRAGATLNIPDAATMRAVDAKYARAMFVKHDQAFRSRRGAGQATASVPIVASTSTQSGAVTAPAASSSTVTATGDQVKLDSASPADQQADIRVANANELREMQSRIETLQKNVEELKDALQRSQAAAGSARSASALGAAGGPGASGSAGVSGSAGTAGTTGAPGATGATGTAGTTGAAGATGASGTTGAVGATSAAGTPGSVGSAGSAGPAGPTGSTGASGAVSSPQVAQAQNTEAAAAREVKTGLAKVKQYASDHVLGLVLGISALLALLIAFLLKRAGSNARKDESDQVPNNPPGLASDFDQKLQSIDLNLSADDKPTPTPTPTSGSTKTSV
jgi:pilus assembly protein FimV